jgi:hypothetical protein
MSKIYSPKIVTDSLVMCLDASNNKSYPTDLPVKNGLALWLDAADDTTFSYSSGTSVSQWRDKSGNNRHFFQATAGNQPSRSAVVNSRKAIQFTAASSQYLRYNSKIINNTTGGSVFVAWRTAGETGAYSSILDNYHCGSNALGAGFQIERNVTNNQYYWGFQTSGCSNAGFIPATSYSNDTTNSIWITKDSTTITGGLNGTSVTPSSSPSATWIEDDKGWTIGAWGGGTESFGRFFNGINCEVIIFNRGLSPTEVKQINTYLGQKWGISNTDRSIVDLAGNNTLLFGTGNVSYMPYFDFYNKGALKFDGSNDFAGVASTTTYGTNTTWEAWVNRSASANQYNMFMGAYLPYFGLMADGSVIFSNIINSVQQTLYSTGFTSSNDTWYYLSFTTDYNGTNTTARIYINGVLNNSATFTGAQSAANEYFGIGDGRGTSSWYPFNGKVSNVKVYNRTLSAAEVLQNYEAQKSKFANTIVQQGLVLNLDAGNIYSYGGAGTTIYDVSGNSNNGTLTNSPTYSNNSIVFSNTANQSISISDTATLQPTSVTLSAWVYMTQYNPLNDFDGQFPTILWKCNDGNSGGAASYGLSLATGGYPRFTIAPTPLVSTTTFPIATWVNLVGVYTVGGSQILYRNGVVDIATTGPATISYSAQVVSVGTRVFNGTYQYPWNGSISNALIHNRALTATEVLQNYNATKGRFGL